MLLRAASLHGSIQPSVCNSRPPPQVWVLCCTRLSDARTATIPLCLHARLARHAAAGQRSALSLHGERTCRLVAILWEALTRQRSQEGGRVHCRCVRCTTRGVHGLGLCQLGAMANGHCNTVGSNAHCQTHAHCGRQLATWQPVKVGCGDHPLTAAANHVSGDVADKPSSRATQVSISAGTCHP
jgi:hypothetical protein